METDRLDSKNNYIFVLLLKVTLATKQQIIYPVYTPAQLKFMFSKERPQIIPVFL